MTPGPLPAVKYAPGRHWRPSCRAIGYQSERIPSRVRGAGKTPRKKVLGASVGAFTSGVDLVGRHAYALTARAFLPTGGYSGGRAAGFLTYRYAGLGNPALGLTVSQNWDEERVRVRKENGDAPVDTTFVLERTRYAGLSVGVARPRAWSNLSLTLSGGVVREDREALDSALNRKELPQFETPSSTLGEVAARFSASTARSHAFQLGQAAGASFSVLARRRIDLDRASSDDRSLDDATGDVRAYMKLPGGGFAAPVLALRASAGIARRAGQRQGGISVSAARPGDCFRFGDTKGPPARVGARGPRRSNSACRLHWRTAPFERICCTSTACSSRSSPTRATPGAAMPPRQPGRSRSWPPVARSCTPSACSACHSASASARGTGSPTQKGLFPTSSSGRRFERKKRWNGGQIEDWYVEYRPLLILLCSQHTTDPQTSCLGPQLRLSETLSCLPSQEASAILKRKKLL